ncbi:MAG TPA: DUF1501 domain-containing protein [Fimbriimonadaceae bacterium]|nr:DUF1501 domain-containing protein [Fimbriimonadaceae bacterium]
MDPLRESELLMTRRQLFGRTACGVGTAALSRLLAVSGLGGLAGLSSASESQAAISSIAPKAKRVIFLFMSGGPSQLDLWEYKPKLRDLYNADLPDEVRRGQRVTTMTRDQQRFPVAPSIFKFNQHDNGNEGVWVRELLPHTAEVVKEPCIVKSMWTEAINHDPATTYLQTGSQIPGRPSLGAWLSYGLGSMNENLPTFVVLHSKVTSGKPNQAVYPRLWGSGFLPSHHQGTAFRQQGDPVLFLRDPEGLDRKTRRTMLDSVAALNQDALTQFGDPEIAARIKQYELAYQLQASVPDLMDLSKEPNETFELYGPASREPGTFASNCLLARRMAQRGVRFIQIFQRGWDMHSDLAVDIPTQAKDVDQGCAALIKDLKRTGMLEDTLVVWAGEFGRTVYCQGPLSQTNYGRDHHPRAYTIWMAGGGVKPGMIYGQTDDFGYNIVDSSGAIIDPSLDSFTPGAVHVHDLNATILHQLGIDHTKLTYKYQGREFRLTDVHGHVVKDLLK